MDCCLGRCRGGYQRCSLITLWMWFFPLQNVTSSPQYSTFLEHIIPRFLTFLQDGEVQFLQEKPTQVGVALHIQCNIPGPKGQDLSRVSRREHYFET